jgi:putative oxidoreductase
MTEANSSILSSAKDAVRSLIPFRESRSLTDLGLLVFRFTLGFEFFTHGMQKFGWFGGTFGSDGGEVTGEAAIEAQAEFLTILGYDLPLTLSWFLTFTELIGGILLMAGFLTPLGAAAVIGDMLNIFNLGWNGGWSGNENGGGVELPVVLGGFAAAIALLGPGRFSVDRLLGWRLSGVPWGVFGLVLALVVGLFVLVVIGPGFGGIDLAPPPEAGANP